MNRFEMGDLVRIDIPDETDLNHDRWQGGEGEVIEFREDDAGDETGDPRDSMMYRVRLDSGEEVDLRGRDWRPLFDSE